LKNTYVPELFSREYGMIFHTPSLATGISVARAPFSCSCFFSASFMARDASQMSVVPLMRALIPVPEPPPVTECWSRDVSSQRQARGQNSFHCHRRLLFVLGMVTAAGDIAVTSPQFFRIGDRRNWAVKPPERPRL
jgi:hypothetical protein